MKTNRSVKKATKLNVNKSYISTAKPKDNSFLLQDQQQTKNTKETVSTHRSQASTKLKINNVSNLRFRNMVYSTKNNRRDNSQKELAPTSQNSRQHSSRSHSQDNNEIKLRKRSNHSRQRSQNQPAKKKRQQLPSQEETRIKKKQQMLFKDIDSPNQISHTEMTKRDQYFENGLKDLQQEILVTKSELYEQIYKTDCLNQKYAMLKNDAQSIQLKYEKEKENSQKLQLRNQRFKDKYKVKKDEVSRMKKEFEEVIEQRNDEINRIRESIDASMQEFFKKGEKAAFLTKDLTYKLSQLHKLLRDDKQPMNHRMVYQALMDAMLLGDKIFEIIRIYDINGKLSTIDFQSMEGQQMTMDIQNENSICNFYNNNNGNTTDNNGASAIEKGEFFIADQQKRQMLENQCNILEEMKLKIEGIQSENISLREERDLFIKQLQKLESSNKNQEKIIQFMNQSQNQQSSFHSNNNHYSTGQDPKQGTAQAMAPMLLSGTDTHFYSNNINGQTNNNCQIHAIDNSNLVQSDPGMQFYYNQHNQEKTLKDYQEQHIQHAETFQDKGSNKVPPLLIIKDPNEFNQNSNTNSTIRTGLTSTTNQANNNFKNKQQILSPGSTLSMQHIQLSNYRSPIANNAQSFTLSHTVGNDYGQQQQMQQQQQIQQLQQQYNLNQFLYEGKASGRSHETSTFQQHQDFLESLKEVGEEAEDDDNSNFSKNKSQISYQHQEKLGRQIFLQTQHCRYDYVQNYEMDAQQESRIRISNRATPTKNDPNKENSLPSGMTTNEYDSIPVDKLKSNRYMRHDNNKLVNSERQNLQLEEGNYKP